LTVKRCEQYDCDLVEVTAHAGSRPEHADWQGKVYSLTGKTKGYRRLEEATGYGTVEGLAGANCSHSFGPYFPGMSKQNDNSDIPKGAENEEIYANMQKQRYLERQIRSAKRTEAALGAAGYDTQDAHNKVLAYQSKMRYHIEETNLRRRYNRETI
ncbi:minor capsid protein, partial [Candidatus Saccharibacteria bacterium]|nr:minor capsid protein [Candidatus Saccharibacteria bacterium]